MLPIRTTRVFGIPAPAAPSLDDWTIDLDRSTPGVAPAASVDVWTIKLDRSKRLVSSLEKVLDASERARAERLWEGPLRTRFIVAQGATRHILARYLGIAAAEVHFDRLSGGKPTVRGAALDFSLSQSGNFAVLAVTVSGRVGVDVEQVRPVSEADETAAEMFTPDEACQYENVPVAERPAVWFSGWTRKKAFLKAAAPAGQRPLSSVDVDLAPETTSPRVNDGGDTLWFMQSFSPARGFTAALAADFPMDDLTCLEWTGPKETVEPTPILEYLAPIAVSL
jgi:4'-phosphopantetheinyl transferase